jgi:hypothetical protein
MTLTFHNTVVMLFYSDPLDHVVIREGRTMSIIYSKDLVQHLMTLRYPMLLYSHDPDFAVDRYTSYVLKRITESLQSPHAEWSAVTEALREWASSN